ncbi:MAG: hypothetical protein QOH40_2421, partial [Arthrobacter pascens]|nr:hypothetical protein [Arthrobacter pascens]
ATVFAPLTADSSASLDGIEDSVNLPVEHEPDPFRRDLAAIRTPSHQNSGG